MSDDIVKLEQAVTKMADSVHELTISLAGYCAKQDGLSESLHELKDDHKSTKVRTFEKIDRLDERQREYERANNDRLKPIEQAIGVGKVFDDINLNKVKNMTPWIISVVAIVAALYDKLT